VEYGSGPGVEEIVKYFHSFLSAPIPEPRQRCMAYKATLTDRLLFPVLSVRNMYASTKENLSVTERNLGWKVRSDT
jgi:hypothetical protein